MPSQKSILSQVPSDIDISQAAVPLPIDQIAADAGILPKELEPYGLTVVAASEKPSQFRFLYPLEMSIQEKFETIVRETYGGVGVEYLPEVEKKIALYTRNGFDKVPICMAKTHLSLSHDPTLKGAPSGFIVPVRDIRASVGAGFLYPPLGAMSAMPGLPTRPAYYDVDLDLTTGPVIGLV
jgi:formyltetrahydrofolate synthetase